MPPVLIQPYDVDHDERSVYALWQTTLGHLWPLPLPTFHHLTVDHRGYQPGDHAVAKRGDAVVGFIGTQTGAVAGDSPLLGEVMVVIVARNHRRQGIGRALLSHALASFAHGGITRVQLGGGGVSYFWPGVPTNLPDAWPFFAVCGWREAERSFDLVRSLHDYATPIGISARMVAQGIVIATAKPIDTPAVLAFEALDFPAWLAFFEGALANREYDAVLIARGADGGIVGTALLLSPQVRGRRAGLVWEGLLGEKTGGVGTVGVAQRWRGKGIGLALTAHATEILREWGVATSYIGWTWLVDWYGELGYRVWREYRMSQRAL